MGKKIGKVVATEKQPTTIDELYFWTDKEIILSPFDIVKVEHINASFTYGVIKEISHITDAPSSLTSYVSHDFGSLDVQAPTLRIGMNYVKAEVVGNSKNIYIPVADGRAVSLAEKDEITEALGIDRIKNKIVCGYLNMYATMGETDRVSIPVHFDSNFLIGPEGAHLNISGISGLAAKTSYAMFLFKSLQQYHLNNNDQSVAFVFMNVKGKDLLAIDEPDESLPDADKKIYKNLSLDTKPFQNVTYYYPAQKQEEVNSYVDKLYRERQFGQEKAFRFKYVYEEDKDNIDLMFSNVEDPNQTMESIINFILNDEKEFSSISNWKDFLEAVEKRGRPGNIDNKELTALSWRKFQRHIQKNLKSNGDLFSQRIDEKKSEMRLQDAVKNIKKNEVMVVDIARLNENMQSFIFGDVIRAVYALKLGQYDNEVKPESIPSRIVIFVDELNKYASGDVPRNSPILRQIIDITERGRSLGIVFFSAEQFKSAIHDRVTGNCSTHAYGRTNAIEISKRDYSFIPPVFKNMMTRLDQGEYILQHPVYRTLLRIQFPKPLYKQFK